MNKMEEVEFLIDRLNEFKTMEPELLTKVFAKKSLTLKAEFAEAYDLLVDMHENEEKYKGVKAKTKGELLEDIIKIALLSNNMFEIFENITNDTNEYDIIIKPNEIGGIFSNEIPDILRNLFIIECKNYKDTIGVTWIGKLYSLLSLGNINLGIIFSYEPLTGSGWEDGEGLVKKIFLKDGIAIINLNKEDYELIKNGEKSIYKIITEKYENLIFATDLNSYKLHHSSNVNIIKLKEKIFEEVESYKCKKSKSR